jgi:hypothetical protein
MKKEGECGTKEWRKSADYLEQFFKTNVKPYFSSYRDTLTNFAAYNVVGYRRN